jgi:Domain of unknown function (DUF5916)/Carbohydrate family 9 binding domain-like
MLRRVTWLILTLMICGQISAQQKSFQAVKVKSAPRIDGVLDDVIWQNVPVATDFIINSPDFGKPASHKTEVKVLYDNTSIYVGAYMYDDPKLIRRQLTPRDQERRADVDYFSLSLDTYNDNQNGFQFTVTTANVQSDVRLSAAAGDGGDFGNNGDYSWDAVWISKTSITKDGWIVEMKIPFSALRFAKKPVQDWGIQFQRFSRRNNESAYWNTVDPNVNGFINQFGDLKGLENIEPPLRLSFLPYVTVGGRSSPQKDGSFSGERITNGGMDVKYGINQSFTLDMTLIPDFGQVVSDNVVLNLSPFEIQFQENRPFFTEGVELFNKAGIFYSRRVGAQPSGFSDAIDSVNRNDQLELSKNPGSTQLYNATKFSGRTNGNLGIGVFNAVSAPVYATLRNRSTGQTSRYLTEPLSNYNIIVLDQALKNRSYITFTNTNVTRNGDARDANVSALDLNLYDKKNTYSFRLKGRYSSIREDVVTNGYNAYIGYGKVSGKIQFDVSTDIISNKYDPNDLGILFFNNQINNRLSLSYNRFTPTKHFLSYSYSLNVNHNLRYKPTSFQDYQISGSLFYLLKNFWDIRLSIETKPQWYNDYFEARTPGRVMKRQPYWFAGLFGSSDSRKKLFFSYGIGLAESPVPRDPLYILESGLRYRFNDRLSVSLNINANQDNGQFGYAFIRESNGDPIIARRTVTQFTSILSGIYNFTPRMNLTFRGRHYWSSVDYTNFYNLDESGYWIDRSFINGRDQNFNAFNVDCFYTWDFRPGSRLILAWKNWLSPYAEISGTDFKNYTSNIRQVFNQPHGNEVTLRFIYFIDYTQLKRSR